MLPYLKSTYGLNHLAFSTRDPKLCGSTSPHSQKSVKPMAHPVQLREPHGRDIIAIEPDILARNYARPAECRGATLFKQQIPAFSF